MSTLRYATKNEEGKPTVKTWPMTDEESRSISALLLAQKKPSTIRFRGSVLKTAALDIVDEASHEKELSLDDPAVYNQVRDLEYEINKFPSPWRFENYMQSLGVVTIKECIGMDYTVNKPAEFSRWSSLYSALGDLENRRWHKRLENASPEERAEILKTRSERIKAIGQGLAFLKNATAIESQTPVGYQEASPELSPRISQNLASQNDEEIPYIDTCPHCMSSIGCNCGETLKNIPF